MSLYDKILGDPQIMAIAAEPEVGDLLDQLEEFLDSGTQPNLKNLRRFSKDLYSHNLICKAFQRALETENASGPIGDQPTAADGPVEGQGSPNGSGSADTTQDPHFQLKLDLLNARGGAGRGTQYATTDFLTRSDISELQLDENNEPIHESLRKLIKRATNRHQAINDSIKEFRENNREYRALGNIVSLSIYKHVQLFERTNDDETKPKFLIVSREKSKQNDFTLLKAEIEVVSEIAGRRACSLEHHNESTQGGLLTPLSFYEKTADDLDKKDKIPIEEIKKLPMRLGLVLAFYETQRSLNCAAIHKTNSVVYQLLANQPLPDRNETRHWVRTQVRAFTRRLRSGANQEFRSVSDFRRLAKHLAAAFRYFYGRLEVQDERFNLHPSITETWKEVISSYRNALQELMNAGDVAAEEKIRATRARDLILANDENYQTLTIEQLDIILRHAIEYRPDYNYVMLQLLTCLRNKELERLDKAFLVGKELNYKDAVEVKGKNRFLSTKTMHKVPRSRLNNAATCALTRYILKYEDFEPAGVQKLFACSGLSKKSIRKKLGQATGGRGGEHQRSLRTAAATWMYRCADVNLWFDRLPLQSVSPKMIADKMAHKDTTMVESIYARSHPADGKSGNYSKYFTFEKLTCKDERDFPVLSAMKLTLADDQEYVLWSQFNAFELMLVKRYIQDMSQVLREQPAEFLKLKTLLAQEAKIDEVKREEIEIPDSMVQTA